MLENIEFTGVLKFTNTHNSIEVDVLWEKLLTYSHNVGFDCSLGKRVYSVPTSEIMLLLRFFHIDDFSGVSLCIEPEILYQIIEQLTIKEPIISKVAVIKPSTDLTVLLIHIGGVEKRVTFWEHNQAVERSVFYVDITEKNIRCVMQLFDRRFRRSWTELGITWQYPILRTLAMKALAGCMETDL